MTNGLKAQIDNPELKVKGLDPHVSNLIEKLHHFNQVRNHKKKNQKPLFFFVRLKYREWMTEKSSLAPSPSLQVPVFVQSTFSIYTSQNPLTMLAKGILVAVVQSVALPSSALWFLYCWLNISKKPFAQTQSQQHKGVFCAKGV